MEKYMYFLLLVLLVQTQVISGQQFNSLDDKDDDPYANSFNDYDVGSFSGSSLHRTNSSIVPIFIAPPVASAFVLGGAGAGAAPALSPRRPPSNRLTLEKIVQNRAPRPTRRPATSRPPIPVFPEASSPLEGSGNVELDSQIVSLKEFVDGKEMVDGVERCQRTCDDDDKPLACHFEFVLDYNETCSSTCAEDSDQEGCSEMGCIESDGMGRGVVAVNSLLPGPAIRVCEGDTVIVDVVNFLNESTSIHWHGIHQKKAPWMDGVPMVTQCPIRPGEIFTYKFDVPLGGTYFWHSHFGVQRGDGIYGSLIVRKNEKKEAHGPMNGRLYDHDLKEHEMIVMDWQDRSLIDVFKGTTEHGRSFHPVNLLVNGKGIPKGFFNKSQDVTLIKPKLPLQEFRIKQNEAYRFRIISNAITSCPIEISVEGHEMMAIASDGFEIAPVRVDSLVIYAGERFDVIIRGNQPIGSYWMKFRGLNYCNDPNTTEAYQVAVLNYEHSRVPVGTIPRHFIRTWRESKPARGGNQLNPLNFGPGVRGRNITIAEVSNIHDPEPEIIAQEIADYKFYLSYDFNRIDNIEKLTKHVPKSVVHNRMTRREYTPQINLITHVPPKTPLLTQPETMDSLFICNGLNNTFVDHVQERADLKSGNKGRDQDRGRHLTGNHGGKNCTKEFCACTHLLKVQLNSIVELILIDNGQLLNANHPFHLHGHSFRVVGMERLANATDLATIKTMDENDKLKRRRTNAPIKDTVTVPDGGYTILRFKADNPGFWFFHCHIEFHVEVGMGLIIQVGEQNEMKKPPSDFPTCTASEEEETTTSSTSTSTTTSTSTPKTPEDGEGNDDEIDEPTGVRTFRSPIERTMKSPSSIHFDDYRKRYYWACVINNNTIQVRTSRRLTHWSKAKRSTVYEAPEGQILADPKIHDLDGVYYIYFSRTDPGTRTNSLYVIEGEQSSDSYSARGDGIYGERIRLDLEGGDFNGRTPTVMTLRSKLYLIWSGQVTEGSERPLGLYMAPMSSPTEVSGEAVLILKPESPWEGVTIGVGSLDSSNEVQENGVIEYPDVTQIGDRTYLLFSANERWSDEKCVGMAVLHDPLNPLKSENWERGNKCMFKQNPAESVYGIGSFALTMSPDLSEMWIVYEARSEPNMGNKTESSVRAQKLEKDEEGLFHLEEPRGLGYSLPIPSGQKPTKY